MVKALCDKCRSIQELKNLACIEININTYGIQELQLYYCASCVRKFRDELKG